MTVTVPPATVANEWEHALKVLRDMRATRGTRGAERDNAVEAFRRFLEGDAASPAMDWSEALARIIESTERRENRLNQGAESHYNADVVAWSGNQARLMRSVSLGLISPKTLDWDNLIEEIESVGRSELHAVESLLTQALIHDLKCAAWPDTIYVEHWRAEARIMRRDARRHFTNSMRQKINVTDLYDGAMDGLPGHVDLQPPLPVPQTCTATLDDILASPFQWQAEI